MLKPFEVCPIYLLKPSASPDVIFYKGKETEHNWLTREQAVQRVRGMLKGEVHIRYAEPFFIALKEGFIQWSLKTVVMLTSTFKMDLLKNFY